jgi:hypothetical protein
MSAKRFRQIALKLDGASEGVHQDHADFRVNGRVFERLGYPDEQWGMVKLTPEQQAVLVEAEPAIFRPVPGGWGKSGNNYVNLAAADTVTLKSVLTMAWQNALSKGRTAKPRAFKPAAKTRKQAKKSSR